MTAREQILQKLRATRQPFADVEPISARRDMVPITDTSPEALRAHFIEQAEALSCTVWEAADTDAGLRKVLDLIGDDTSVMHWDFAHIPLPGLAEAMANAGINSADIHDGTVRVGISGAQGALASTGTLALKSGVGRPRQVSLLPMVHIAIITADQIMPHLEAWLADQGAAGLRDAQHIALVSGPSRTADIAMELIMGVHGPGELHIILLPAMK